jgi:16S rRNA (uracil1498-N3)-methyltransferase
MTASYRPLPRLYVPAALQPGALVRLEKPHAHYLLQVMRQKLGDVVLLFNGRDGEWRAEITQADKKGCELQLKEQTRPQTAEPDIWLLFAPVKYGRIDYLVEKATELGVAALYPVRTQRTIVSRINNDRLDHHAIEAAEQSERLTLPVIDALVPLVQKLAQWPEDRLLIYGDETGQGKAPPDLLPPLKGKKLALLVGPEGGFAPEELEQLRAMKNAYALSLGPRVLRADTAALAGLTCLMALTGEWDA